VENKLKGYKGNSIDLLKKYKVEIWDIIQITTNKTQLEGIIMPRSEFSAPDFIEIKLENNYNVGINVSDIQNIKKIGKREANYKLPEKEFPHNKDLPELQLLGTGGTVASRLDYTTGAVIPSFTPSELFSSVPELAEICNLDCEVVFEILSENMKFEYWQKLAEKVKQAVDSGFDGVIIGHGTDTMSFTSAALSAAIVATSDIAEVVVTMLGSPSHDYGLIHSGTLVRKMHSSVRDTFRTIDDIPLGMVRDRKIKMFKNNYRKRNKSETTIKTNFEKKVALIYSYPGMENEQIEFYIDRGYKGIVFAGTGLGHVSTHIYDSIERAIQENITILMTTQTIHGYVGMNVYSTGRELQDLGVIPGRNLLPEVGYVKLGWVLGQTSDLKEIKNLLLSNIAGEFLEREIPIAFNYNIDELLKNNKL